MEYEYKYFYDTFCDHLWDHALAKIDNVSVNVLKEVEYQYAENYHAYQNNTKLLTDIVKEFLDEVTKHMIKDQYPGED